MADGKRRVGVLRLLLFLALGALVLIFSLSLFLWAILRPPSINVPEQGVLLSNVTIINPGLDRQKVSKLVVRGEIIDQILTDTSASAADAGADGNPLFEGAFVLPGLIDMHVHYPSKWDRELYSLLYLMHGVSAVRELGNMDGSIWETRQMIETGEFPGPRIFTGGQILDGDPPVWPGSKIIKNAEDAKFAVTELSARGADCIKVYSMLSPEALVGIRKAAVEQMLPVVGHVPFSVPFEEARIQDVQHLLGLWDRYRWEDWDKIDSERIEEYVRISAEQGIAHTPTIVQWDHLSRALDTGQQVSATARLLPRYYRSVLWSRQEGFPIVRNSSPEMLAGIARAIPIMKYVVWRLHEAGVRIHVGTDSTQPFVVPGASMHEEMRNFVDAGLTPEEVWKLATSSAGDSLGMPNLGVIREGAPADFLIFREDPTLDLQALSSLQAVVAQGRLYTKEALDEAYARHRKHFESFFYDRISTEICRFLLRSVSAKALNAT